MGKTWGLLCFLFIMLSSNVSAIEPVLKLKASGDVMDMVKEGGYLYAATDAGIVDVFDIPTGKLVKKITVPGMKDFMGDDMASKVYSVDKLAESKDVLLVCQGEAGFRNVYIYNTSLDKVIDAAKDKMMVREARFVNPGLVLLGLTSDELILFDLKKGSVVYRKQISHYTFDDMVLNEDRSKVLTSDESGVIQMFNVGDGALVKTYKGSNVDNVFQIDYKNKIVIGGGQDRRLAIYDDNLHNQYYIQGDFLIYSVGLSPSGKTGAYAANEDNDVVVFDVATQEVLYILKGQVSTLTKILFYSEKELITSCESDGILFWKLND
ncbi:MAG: WD40 repeat domain-containing protein [Chlorobi bacterium]|nr:WD40 repeat domain-containing protein [Chlorobiota bacterium]